jgi:hypothetical protein
MQYLRNAHAIARFVLVWFVLSMGVAVASPLVKSPVTELICFGSWAMTVMLPADDGSTPATSPVSHAWDCPLCAGLGAPLSETVAKVDPVQPLSYVLKSMASSHITVASATSLPARGPPTTL